MKNQGHRGNTFGCDVGGEARAVKTAVAIFVDAEEAARQRCHLRDVIEGADLSDQSLTGGVYWVVLNALCGAEFLEVHHEFVHTQAGTFDNLGKRALDVRLDVRHEIVDAWWNPGRTRRLRLGKGCGCRLRGQCFRRAHGERFGLHDHKLSSKAIARFDSYFLPDRQKAGSTYFNGVCSRPHTRENHLAIGFRGCSVHLIPFAGHRVDACRTAKCGVVWHAQGYFQSRQGRGEPPNLGRRYRGLQVEGWAHPVCLGDQIAVYRLYPKILTAKSRLLNRRALCGGAIRSVLLRSRTGGILICLRVLRSCERRADGDSWRANSGMKSEN